MATFDNNKLCRVHTEEYRRRAELLLLEPGGTLRPQPVIRDAHPGSPAVLTGILPAYME